ncbi:hypothetical protein [Brachybacterium paraconglomeratum]|uniref:hypothetical protein n=1 Tax=Brachybacterium paraconglomeratum TaxID=173362 RepID=UPI0035142ADB
MRLRTRVCAASAALTLCALPLATGTALADETEGAAVSTTDPADTPKQSSDVETPADTETPAGAPATDADETESSPVENEAPSLEVPEKPPESSAEGSGEKAGAAESDVDTESDDGARPEGGDVERVDTPEGNVEGVDTSESGGGRDISDDGDDGDGESSLPTGPTPPTCTDTPSNGATKDPDAGTDGAPSMAGTGVTLGSGPVPRLIAYPQGKAKPDQKPGNDEPNKEDPTECPCGCTTSPSPSPPPTPTPTPTPTETTPSGEGPTPPTDPPSSTDEDKPPEIDPESTTEQSPQPEPAPEPEPSSSEQPEPQPRQETERTTAEAPAPISEEPSETPVEEPQATEAPSTEHTEQTTEETEVAGVGTEEPSTPAPQSAQPTSSGDGGPVVRLFNAISDDSNTAFGQMRQVLIAALAIGFLTTAGFVGATWHSRRSNHRR